MKGTVSWYNDSKGFGFVKGEDGEDYFIHFSDIQMDGYKTLNENEEVIFEPGERGFPKGKVATKIVRTGHQMTVVIKDCPCCGSVASYSEYIPLGSLSGVVRHAISCTNCTMNTGDLETKEKAIKIWNRRP